ncbi:uncharacterized protein CXorf65 homolog isoform X2 [Dysidea avara]|uniref:uncharacterized protein CXorf65 homolog isoform X1 n=1 Tax=Dysidea avara TaxID=196820 RepID=UPI003320C6E6
MFITVAVSEGTECLFNPDCMVNVLLAAVKKRSDIPKKEVIDLCSADGTSKGLFKDLEGNAKKYFGHREFCHVVLVVRTMEDEETEKFTFYPVLKKLLEDNHFMSKLNSSDADKATGFPSGGKRTSSPQNRKSSAGYGRRKSNKAHVQVRFKPGH